TAGPVSSSTGRHRARSPTPSPASSRTGPGRRPWGSAAAPGCWRTGAGRTWPGTWNACSRGSDPREHAFRRAVRSDVERLDLLGVRLVHDVALDLQGRGELTGLLGELVREDVVLLDRLGVRHAPVRPHQRLVQVLDQVGVLEQLVQRAGLVVVGLPPFD